MNVIFKNRIIVIILKETVRDGCESEIIIKRHEWKIFSHIFKTVS